MKPSAQLRCLPALLAAGLLLAGCDRLGFPDPAVVAASADAEGKAIGAACRNSGRGLEDCYQKNPKAPKSAVFAGWKDMNEYMTQNKMDVMAPPPPPPAPAAKAEGEDGEKADKAAADGKDDGKDAKKEKADDKPAKESGKADAKEDKPAKKTAKEG